jgi:transcriptional regulator with XRE-family HTH domain
MKKRIYIAQRKLMTELLRGIRLEAGLTQVELAARVGKDQAYVSRYESGQRRLDLLEVREICQALGITLEEFVKRLEKAIK